MGWIRTKAIHGNGQVQALANTEAEVDYLMRVTSFSQGLINFRYWLRHDPNFALIGKQRPRVAFGTVP